MYILFYFQANKKPYKEASALQKRGLCECMENFENLGPAMKILNNMMETEPMENIYFVLNGNNQAHKSTASIILTQMTNFHENIDLYLSYYSHNDEGSATGNFLTNITFKKQKNRKQKSLIFQFQ